MTDNPLIRKLGRWTEFSAEDRRVFDDLTKPVQSVARFHHLIREGDNPEVVFLLLEGWAYRYKLLRDGTRQIVGLLMPGDLCDTHIFILDRMDHGITMLSPGKLSAIPRARMIEVLDHHPTIARAMWWATLVDEAVLREWLLNIGARDALARVAHLFCELRQRAANVGLVTDDAFEVPLTQMELAEALGLTPVHVNRMLQKLRKLGLVEFRQHRLTIIDWHGLRDAAGFEAVYLHAKPANRAPVGASASGGAAVPLSA